MSKTKHDFDPKLLKVIVADFGGPTATSILVGIIHHLKVYMDRTQPNWRHDFTAEFVADVKTCEAGYMCSEAGIIDTH